MKNTTTTQTSNINTINNSTIPNLSTVYLPIINPVCNNLTVNNIDSSGQLTIGHNATSIYIGSSNGLDTKNINIGGTNDTVNITGILNSI